VARHGRFCRQPDRSSHAFCDLASGDGHHSGRHGDAGAIRERTGRGRKGAAAARGAGAAVVATAGLLRRGPINEQHGRRALSKMMTLERATEFGSAWNSGDPDLVASFFADDGMYYASVGPDHLGKAFVGKKQVREGVKAFFARFPGGKFENLKVVVSGNFGTF